MCTKEAIQLPAALMTARCTVTSNLSGIASPSAGMPPAATPVVPPVVLLPDFDVLLPVGPRGFGDTLRTALSAHYPLIVTYERNVL